MAALDALFFKPIMSTTEFMQKTAIPYKSTVRDILKKLESAGVIKPIKEGRGRTPTVFIFHELISITEC